MSAVRNYRFHVNLYADPKEASFACTWEDAAALLGQLPRMIFELDGSFVFSGGVDRMGRTDSSSTPSEADALWHVNGHLFDFAGRLHRIELRGDCPMAAFDALLRCVGWPEQSIAFELVREGTTVDEREFRRLVATHERE